MQLQFANNTILDVLTINGSTRYFQGQSRDSLEIQLAKDTITFDALDALTANPASTVRLTVMDGESQTLYENYVLRAELSVKPVEVSRSVTPDEPPVTEEQLIVVLAQKNYAERELENLRDTVDALVLAAL